LEYPVTYWNIPLEDLCTALPVLGTFLEHSRSQTLKRLLKVTTIVKKKIPGPEMIYTEPQAPGFFHDFLPEWSA